MLCGTGIKSEEHELGYATISGTHALRHLFGSDGLALLDGRQGHAVVNAHRRFLVEVRGEKNG